MAIVSKEKLIFEGGSFERRIKVNKDGIFRINLPPAVSEKLGIKEVTALTGKEALKEYDSVLVQYHSIQTESKKVILFKIEYHGEVWGPPASRKEYKENPDYFKGYDQVCLLSRQECPSSDLGMGLKIKAAVAIERATKRADGSIYYAYDSPGTNDERLPGGLFAQVLYPGYGRRAPNQMDWTPARHAFFVKLNAAMERLIWQVHNMADPEKLIEAADTGRLIPV